MPELPEVESIRMYLHSHIVGKTIKNIEVLNPNSFIGKASDVINFRIFDTSRKGKVLNIHLNNGKYIAVHLKMSGQLLFSNSRENAAFPVKSPLSSDNKMSGRSTRVAIDFDDGTCIFFNDMRKFGWVKISDKEEGTSAPDVTRREFTEKYFKAIVQKSSKPVKTLLMDQDKIAGIGNIYANDSLFVAGILPSRNAKTLSPEEITKLYHACIQVISEGVKYRGTSASEVYVLPDRTKGTYQEHFKVYGLEGKPCKVCGNLIKREKLAGRSSFYCPICQK